MRAPGLDHRRVGVGVEVVERRRRDAGGLERRRRALARSPARDDAAVGDAGARRGRELARQLAQARERAVAEHDPSAQLEIESRHGLH